MLPCRKTPVGLAQGLVRTMPMELVALTGADSIRSAVLPRVPRRGLPRPIHCCEYESASWPPALAGAA